MYCKKCGKQKSERKKFCQHCGLRFDENSINIAENSSDDKSLNNYISVNTAPYPYVISSLKLVVLSITTFGLYEIYWFYKQWKSFKTEKDLKVTPWARALFATLMAYFLFKEVSKANDSVDNTQGKLESGLLAIAYFILISLYRLPEPYWLLVLLSFLPLIPVQNAINLYWQNRFRDKIIVSRFGGWNYVFSIIGGILIVLVLYGTFLPTSTMTPSASTTPTSVSSNNSSTEVQNVNKNQQESLGNNLSSVVDIYCNNNNGGSGTIFLKDGTILTNYHVIANSSYCLVTLPNPTTGVPISIYKATPEIVPILSKQYDLAVLIINSAYTDNDGKTWGDYPTTFPTYVKPESCTNFTPKLGEAIRIYGYPVTSGGYNLTITDGIISSFADDKNILTSAKVDSGNSGGLALNQNGCMVGIPSAVLTGNYQNLGVIIPNSVIIDFIDKSASETYPSPSPFQNQNMQTVPTSQTESIIDCTGPDGKHLFVTQKTCDDFNKAWSPTPSPSPYNYWFWQ